MYKKELKPTLKSATRLLTAGDIDNAERFWILESQSSMEKDILSGKFKRLCPRKRDDGIYVVGGRARGWVEMSYKRSFYYHMSIDSHVYMPSTYIVEVIWECYQPQAKYEQHSGSSNC